MESLTFEDLIDADGLYTPSQSSRSSTSTAPSLNSVSAFRRFTRSPSTTIRSGLRRSIAGNNASVDSLDSQEQRISPPQPPSCVSQQTSRDDCSLNRFIAWAAVRRSASKSMTADQKRECPLLLCQKPFPNQEMMLQHLACCEKLDDGEYWCYDCERRERFTDNKCTKCIGHPSKRRKIVKLARSIFGSLGHKSKNGGPPELDILADELSLHCHSTADSSMHAIPTEPELENFEIHELDSFEMPLSPILEEEDTDVTAATYPPTSIFDTAPITSDSIPYRAGHTSNPQIDWSGRSLDGAIILAQGTEPNSSPTSGKPVLHQIQTSGFDPTRTRSFKKRCSGKLSHSSSTRSNASTVSTISTNSTNSTNSIAVSTMSDWAGNKQGDTGYDSPITSPLEEFVDINEFFPPTQAELNKGMCESHSTQTVTFAETTQTAFMAELPGDTPMLDYGQSSNLAIASGSVPMLPFQPSLPLQPLSTNLANQTSSSSFMPEKSLIVNTIDPCLSSWPAPSITPVSLVQAVRAALDSHVATSTERLRNVKEHSVVRRFLERTPSEVARAGLKLLSSSLQGQSLDDPVDLLCFLHLIYSLSLVMYENSALDRCRQLFSAAVALSLGLSSRDQEAYRKIVALLWTPSEMPVEELSAMIRDYPSSGSSPEGKGKGVADNSDALVFAAEDFLDELEYLTLQESRSPEVISSELSTRHMEDQHPQASLNSPLAASVKVFLEQLPVHYGGNSLFEDSVRKVTTKVNLERIPTARRLELDLTHIGRTYLPHKVFINSYVRRVRDQVDRIYQQSSSYQSSSRIKYHLEGVKLIHVLMLQGHESSGSQPRVPTVPTAPVTMPSEASINTFVESLQFDMNNSFTNELFSFSNNMATHGEASMDADMSTMFPNNSGNMDMTTSAETHQFSVSPDSSTITPPPVSASTMSPNCFSSSSTAIAFSASPSSTPAEASGASTGSTSTPANMGDGAKVEANASCEICGYRPKGDPKWFAGSMAKHKKLQHADGPPKIYRCPFHGCKSQYKNRPDNLRQHQIDKGHFVDGQDDGRKGKRKRGD